MYLQYLLDTLFVSCKAFVNVPANQNLSVRKMNHLVCIKFVM